MAKPQTSSASNPATPPPNAGGSVMVDELEKELAGLGMTDMNSTFGEDALMYSAEETNRAAVVGYPYRIKEMEAGGRKFFGIFFRLYQPSKGMRGKGDDRKCFDVPVGKDLVVPAQAKIARDIVSYLRHPDKVYLIALKPKPEDAKIQTKKGAMWDYWFRKYPTGHALETANRIDLALPGPEDDPVIAEGGNSGEAGDAKSFFEEIDKGNKAAATTAATGAAAPQPQARS